MTLRTTTIKIDTAVQSFGPNGTPGDNLTVTYTDLANPNTDQTLRAHMAITTLAAMGLAEKDLIGTTPIVKIDTSRPGLESITNLIMP